MKFETLNILDAIEIYGEDKICAILSTFYCPLNPEIERFIQHNAIDFAKQKLSITYIVLNELGRIAGFFTLAHKPLTVHLSDLGDFSKGNLKRLKKHSKFDEASQSFELSAFLIAQFGKNADVEEGKISGNQLMALAIDTLRIAQHVVGGGVIFLECDDKEKLLAFYQNAENGYRRYSERNSEQDQKRYIRLLRFF